MKVPTSISFERSVTDVSSAWTKSTEGHSSILSHPAVHTASVDELQALNTALCFLASINADVEEINSFLMAHPHALLLEETGPIPQECAHFIVEEQLQRCSCFAPTCRENRRKVLASLSMGFEHYDLKKWCSSMLGRPLPMDYLDELTRLEYQIRLWRTEELTLRHRLLETAMELQKHREKIERQSQRYRSPALILLTCNTAAAHKQQQTRKALDDKVSSSMRNMESVKQEHGELLRHIRKGRQVQFAVLKQAFSDIRRHVCSTHSCDFTNFPPNNEEEVGFV